MLLWVLVYMKLDDHRIIEEIAKADEENFKMYLKDA